MIQRYEGPLTIEDTDGLRHDARVLEALHKLTALEPYPFRELYADMTSGDGEKVPGYPHRRDVAIEGRKVGSFVPFIVQISPVETEFYGEFLVSDGDDPDERLNLMCSLPEYRVPAIREHFPAHVKIHKTEGTSGVLYVATADEPHDTQIPVEDLHILSVSEVMEQLYRNTQVPEGYDAFALVAEVFGGLRLFAHQSVSS